MGQFLELAGAYSLLAPLREVDEHVGAQRLQDVDGRGERDPVRAVVWRDQRRILEVLRAQAHDDVAAGPGAFHLVAQPVAEPEVAEVGAQHAVLERAGQEVHGRRPDESGHEQVDGPFVEFLRGACLL
jgi:hypothetical protein